MLMAPAMGRPEGGQGTLESQILEYAMFISKVEAAAKGWDKTEDKQRIKERLELFGFVERPTKDDGNCQFYAVSDQLFGSDSKAGELRRLAVQWLLCNPGWNPSGQADGELYKFIVDEPWEAYCARMAVDKQWGDHLTLIALAEVFHVSIFIISSVPGDKFLTQINPGAQESVHAGRTKTVFLAHHLELHYVSIAESQDVALSISGWNPAPWDPQHPAGAPLLAPAFAPSLPAASLSGPSADRSKVLKLLLASANDTRRFSLDAWPQSLPEVDVILRNTFGSALVYDYVLKYKDEEGDFVNISSTPELLSAIDLANRNGLLFLQIQDYPRSF